MAAKALPVTEEGSWGCDSTYYLRAVGRDPRGTASPLPSSHCERKGNQGKKTGVFFFSLKNSALYYKLLKCFFSEYKYKYMCKV